MEIRTAKPGDLDDVLEIDGTVESSRYLHVDRGGEGFALAWRLDERPLREKLIQSNILTDDQRMVFRQVTAGADEGVALVAEHEGRSVAMAVARPDPAAGLAGNAP
jgi:hypothetical protein